MTRERKIETASALVLALATVLTAWCTYQATIWGGEEARYSFRASAGTAREGTLRAQAQQRRSFDAALFVRYASAVAEHEERLATFLYERFQPPLRRGTDAWLATDPLTSPAAPRTPFEMSEYVIPQDEAADAAAKDVAEAVILARGADGVSDRYVLLTVFFAIALFFSGISGKFEWWAIDAATLIFSILILLAAFARMLQLPIQFQ